ncbi:chemotaxis protein MotB [Caulobacter segnis]|jgi:chemotaxis protein MotB|uniref:OmpA/MotB domain protein n=2 Tax=Caulobacter segnis TaxID=88688 RepID=D5VKQ8_CAUST|nr:flagellar motor protein MotB [Caulobacter segnis]ADG11081.1 OmpA/MotB domain protein [Caulobacter segnis ATCC 21756]AVQ02769.1 chemotaxis protein MotB [Caulobacter segnis]
MAVSSEQPILIKKVKKVSGGGHHGGAWKVAYADFVTAMMAFFLLMWLLNTTSPEQKQGIADYFAPASISSTTSGSGGILGGTSLGDDGAKSDGKMSAIQQMAPEVPDNVEKDGQSTDTANLSSASEQALRDALAKKEQDSFASAAQSLRQSLQDMPELAELSKQILIDQTPEGLRIQLVDQEGRSMFQENSKVPNDRARILLRAVAKVITQLPNRVTISGHTSASAYGKKQDGDWSLSASRADASRQILRAAGVDDDRIYQVSGKANSEPLYADDPTLAGNRRISIVLLREKPVLPDGL